MVVVEVFVNFFVFFAKEAANFADNPTEEGVFGLLAKQKLTDKTVKENHHEHGN